MKNNIELLANKLHNKTILILGGTGLFAKHLIPLLSNYIEEKEINVNIYITSRNIPKAKKYIPELNKKFIQMIDVDVFANVACYLRVAIIERYWFIE